MQAGASVGIRPFGVEAQRILRLEKGHVIIGQDTDGLTNPFEAGLGRMAQMDKPFFVGQRSLSILHQRGARQQLIGFTLEAPRAPLAECHLAIHSGDIAGRITSIAWSDTLQKTIGLALLTPSLAVAGGRVQFRDDTGALHAAQLVDPLFYDPRNQAATHGGRGMNQVSTSAVAGVSMPPVGARYGVKGARAAEWLAQHGVALPAAPNRIANWSGSGGGRCLRLGNSEFLVEYDAGNASVPVQAASDGAWLLLRSDASLLLDPQWTSRLAQVCSFDFQRLHDEPDLVVMTLLAGISVTLVREPRPADHGITLRLWCDASYAPYLQQCLQHLARPDQTPGEKPMSKEEGCFRSCAPRTSVTCWRSSSTSMALQGQVGAGGTPGHDPGEGAGFAGFALWGFGMGPHGPDYMAVGDAATVKRLPWMPGHARIVCNAR